MGPNSHSGTQGGLEYGAKLVLRVCKGEAAMENVCKASPGINSLL